MAIRTALWVFLILLSVQPLHASQYGIAAIVNDEAISSVDVQGRLKLAIISSGLPNTEEVRQKLSPQVVQLLIDEALVEQEATKRGIVVSEYDMEDALGSIARKNKIPESQLGSFLASQGISERAVRAQVKAQVYRTKLLSRAVKPQVLVTEQEVEEKMENIAGESGREEFHLSEIILPVDRPEDEVKVKRLALKLFEELKNGADFGAVAREFSRGTTASKGGEIGWVGQDQLSAPLRVRIGGLKSGDTTPPIRLADGYHLIFLAERRALIDANAEESEVGMRQLFLPVAADTGQDQKQVVKTKLNDAKAAIQSCADVERVAASIGSTVDPKMVMVQLKNLNENVRQPVAQAAVGEATPIIANEQGLSVFVVCERIKAEASIAQKNRVKELLLQNKLELQSRKFIQDLRRNGYIEIRI